MVGEKKGLTECHPRGWHTSNIYLMIQYTSHRDAAVGLVRAAAGLSLPKKFSVPLVSEKHRVTSFEYDSMVMSTAGDGFRVIYEANGGAVRIILIGRDGTRIIFDSYGMPKVIGSLHVHNVLFPTPK